MTCWSFIESRGVKLWPEGHIRPALLSYLAPKQCKITTTVHQCEAVHVLLTLQIPRWWYFGVSNRTGSSFKAIIVTSMFYCYIILWMYYRPMEKCYSWNFNQQIKKLHIWFLLIWKFDLPSAKYEVIDCMEIRFAYFHNLFQPMWKRLLLS